MRLLQRMRLRLRSLFRRDRMEHDLEREMRLHFDLLVCEGVDAGLSEADATLAARRAFGSPDVTAEQCRDARRVGVIEDFVRDVGYSLRMFRRTPGFTFTAVVSLALGIGANTAIFSLVDAVLLRSLPVERPKDLVFLTAVGTSGGNGAPPYPCIERFRNETTAFEGIAAFSSDDLRVEVDGRIEQAFTMIASGNFFDVLRLRPAAGRLLSPDDEKLDPPVVVIGYGFWQRRLGGRADAIGRPLTIDGRVYTIVGVTPRTYWGTQPGRQVDLTFPIKVEGPLFTNADTWWLDAVARVRRDVDPVQATTQVDAVFQSFMKDHDGPMRRIYFDHMELRPAGRGLSGLRSRFSTPLSALALAAGLVLLIACANLGGLLVVRGAARGREFAIRLAIGAGAARVVRQLLTETMVLCVLGALASVVVAHVAIQGLTGFFAIGRNPIVLDVRYDWRLAAFAIAVTSIAAVLTGLWPALRTLRTDPHLGMKSQDGRTTTSARGRTTGRLLIVAQVALSFVLLAAAGLFLKTIVNLRGLDMGFRGDRVLTLSLNQVIRGADAQQRRVVFWRETLERIRRLPGVRRASLSVLTPLSGRDTGKFVYASGYVPAREPDRAAHINHVSEDFFQTFQMQLLAGRVIAAQDAENGQRVVVVNETAARHYFGGRNPIGESIQIGKADARPYQVVGLIRDHRHRDLREAATRFIYVPIWQPVDPLSRLTLAVDADAAAPQLAAAITQEVQAIYPQVLVSDVIAVNEQIDATLISERLLSTLASAFGAVALALAAIGIYALLSFSVARRRVELGIRLALGARPAQVAVDVMREAVVNVVLGIAIGLPLALLTARAAARLLYGVTPGNPWAYVLGIGVLIAAAAVASWLPVRRACAIDPCESLRREA